MKIDDIDNNGYNPILKKQLLYFIQNLSNFNRLKSIIKLSKSFPNININTLTFYVSVSYNIYVPYDQDGIYNSEFSIYLYFKDFDTKDNIYTKLKEEIEKYLTRSNLSIFLKSKIPFIFNNFDVEFGYYMSSDHSQNGINSYDVFSEYMKNYNRFIKKNIDTIKEIISDDNIELKKEEYNVNSIFLQFNKSYKKEFDKIKHFFLNSKYISDDIDDDI